MQCDLRYYAKILKWCRRRDGMMRNRQNWEKGCTSIPTRHFHFCAMHIHFLLCHSCKFLYWSILRVLERQQQFSVINWITAAALSHPLFRSHPASAILDFCNCTLIMQISSVARIDQLLCEREKMIWDGWNVCSVWSAERIRYWSGIEEVSFSGLEWGGRVRFFAYH